VHGGNKGYNAAGNFHDSLAVLICVNSRALMVLPA
jgi:hypothetical protein